MQVKRKSGPRRMVVGSALACALLAGCGCSNNSSGVEVKEDPDRAAEPKTEQLTIKSNTQSTLGDVRIGAGNFWERQYTDDQGKERKGQTAMLWIYLRGKPDEKKSVVVYPGKELEAGELELRVDEVGDDVVTLTVKSSP